MNLNKLFTLQDKLDDHIKKEKGLEGQDLLDKKILALQVELGELANEWRGFKFWSKNQEPHRIVTSDSVGCDECALNNWDKDPLLEEYVDCLHFTLSIGNDIKVDTEKVKEFIFPKKMPSILDQFMWTNYKLITLYKTYRDDGVEFTPYHYTHMLNAILGLGEILGFTWEQIEQAYISKNETNHERQVNGY